MNGIRSCLGHGFAHAMAALQPDVICLQEVKAQQEQVGTGLPAGYAVHWNTAQKKGYSGTAVLSRVPPQAVHYGIGMPECDVEGRAITLRFADFALVNVYSPNSRADLSRLPLRMAWDDALRAYVQQLDSECPVLLCGDLNCAYAPMDLAHPAQNHQSAGFTDDERQKLGMLLDFGFLDSFRYFYPQALGRYSWWSYRAGARARNVGWRIDYWLCSRRFAPRLASAGICDDVLGSDHCPVTLGVRD